MRAATLRIWWQISIDKISFAYDILSRAIPAFCQITLTLLLTTAGMQCLEHGRFLCLIMTMFDVTHNSVLGIILDVHRDSLCIKSNRTLRFVCLWRGSSSSMHAPRRRATWKHICQWNSTFRQTDSRPVCPSTPLLTDSRFVRAGRTINRSEPIRLCNLACTD